MDEEYTPQIRPTHRLELRVRGLVSNIREGPYITHNYIASHVQFLKKVNEGRGRQYNVWRILPVGGKFNSRGDVLALLVWYLMLVYAAVAIPTTADKYIGLQNYFIDITADNAKEIHCVTASQKTKIVQNMTNHRMNQVVLMLMTASYLRGRRRDPIICLSVLAVLCLVGLVVQLETMRVVLHDH